MKKLLVVLLVLAAITSTFVGCKKSVESNSVTLMQNKPEIDPQLKAYAATWSEKTGIATTIKSIGGSSSVTLGQQLRTDFAAGDMPDIFIIAGPEDYKRRQYFKHVKYFSLIEICILKKPLCNPIYNVS